MIATPLNRYGSDRVSRWRLRRRAARVAVEGGWMCRICRFREDTSLALFYHKLIAAYSPPTSHSARGRGIGRRHGGHEPAEGSAGRGAIQAPAGARDPPAADVTSPTNLATRASRKPPTGKTTTQHFRTPLP